MIVFAAVFPHSEQLGTESAVYIAHVRPGGSPGQAVGRLIQIVRPVKDVEFIAGNTE